MPDRDPFQTFFQLSTEGMWRSDLNPPMPLSLPEDEQIEHMYAHTQMCACNAAMAAMYGIADPADFLGTPLTEVLVRTDPMNEQMLRSFIQSNYRLVDMESTERGPDGKPRYFLNNFIGIVQDGKLVEAWGTQRDVTANRLLGEQLQQAQKMEAVGRLAAGVAHDFNNLLGIVLGAVGFAERAIPAGHAALPELRDIRDAADRGAALTRQLLVFSSAHATTPKILDLNGLLDGASRLLRRVAGERVTLKVTNHDDLGFVRADAGQLEQVILNLVINARDAIDKSGTIAVETTNVVIDQEHFEANGGLPAGGYVAISVTDTGTGMTDEVKARIFEPFFTTKAPGAGTGLGLATSYAIVRQAGGAIDVTTELGRGTTFRVYLPRIDEAPAAQTTATTEALRGDETILLVDDDEGLLKLMQRALETSGYRVVPVRSGDDALRLYAASLSPIDLLVTDVAMPGIDGTELARELRRRTPGLRTLFVSGFSHSLFGADRLGEGATLLMKPFTIEDLARSVRRVLDSVAPSPRPRS